jgi:hypothetical protein
MGAKPSAQALGGAIVASAKALEKHGQTQIAKANSTKKQEMQALTALIDRIMCQPLQPAKSLPEDGEIEGVDGYASLPPSNRSSQKRGVVSPCKSSRYDKERQARDGSTSHKAIASDRASSKKLSFIS